MSSRGAVERGRDSEVDRVWRARGASGGVPGEDARAVWGLFFARAGRTGGVSRGGRGARSGGRAKKSKNAFLDFSLKTSGQIFDPF